MADAQGFIQPYAQSATPSSVNNGNPNTVYNAPQTGASRPLQGWSIQQPAAANLNLNNTAQGAAQMAGDLIRENGWMAPEQSQPINVPKLTVPEGWMATPPTMGQTDSSPGSGGSTTTPTTPVKDTSGFQWVVMNGKVPGMNQNLYNTDPAYKAAWDQAVREHDAQFKKSYTKDSSVQAITDRLKTLYNQFSNGGVSSNTPQTGTGTGTGSAGAGVTQGAPLSQETQQWVNSIASGGTPVINMNKGWASGSNGDTAKIGEALTNVANSFASLGDNVNVSSVLQFLDVITEPYMPGNLYLSELGQANAQGILKSVMNMAIPGLGSLASKIAAAIPDTATGLLGKIRDWVKEGNFNELANNVYKGARKDNESKVESGNLDASQRPSGGSGGGGMGSGGAGGWMSIGGGKVVHPDNYMPNITVGESRTA